MALANDQAYEQHVESNEYHKLRYYTEKANLKREEYTEDNLFINLSLREILGKLSSTFIDILTELTTVKITSIKDIVIIFFTGDRMIYIGLMLLIIAFFIYLLDI